MSKKTPPQEGLDLPQDLPFLRRQWTFQRAAWVCLALALLAAMLGLLGGGPLSRGRAVSKDGSVEARYERFARRGARADLHLTLSPHYAPDRPVAVRIDGDYLRNVEVKSVTPDPERVEARPDDYVYHFLLPSDGPATVVFQLIPESAGVRRVRLGVDGQEPVDFWQFVYP